MHSFICFIETIKNYILVLDTHFVNMRSSILILDKIKTFGSRATYINRIKNFEVVDVFNRNGNITQECIITISEFPLEFRSL